ncbi:MAG: ABC1 kinase family protein [Nitrospiria bacterium]
MGLKAFQINLADLNRLRKILTVVSLSGGNFLLVELRLKYLIPIRARLGALLRKASGDRIWVRREGATSVVSPSALRIVLEELGPTFIKLGQVLSLRADLVGEDLSREFSKLQSEAPPFPCEEARKIVKEEMGKFPEELFLSFEEIPVAAASLAQVHRAFLKDGKEVAVKIQRPNIRKVIEQDIHILYYAAGLAERFLPELKIYRPTQVVKQFADWTLRELDFIAEGHNAERFRYIFKDNPQIVFPEIHWDFTTKRVLTMGFSHGVKVSCLDEIKNMGADSRKIASIGVEVLFHQFFIAGFFHADPHPGNFFVTQEGKLCLHDFGMVGYLDQISRRELISCLIAFVNKDIEGYTRHFLHLGRVNEKSDVSGFEKDVSNILSEFFYSERQPSIAWAFFRVINRGAENGIWFPSDLALFGKALVTTESMGHILYPEFNLNKELEPFLRKALIAQFDPKMALRAVQNDVLDTLGFLKSFPERVNNVLNKMEKGEIGIKLDTDDLYGIKKEFDRQNDLRILGIVVTAVFFATFGLFYLEGRRTLLGFSLSNLGLTLFVFLLGWFLYKIRQGPRNN